MQGNVGCYSEARAHNRIMMLYTTRLSWPTYLPCIFLYMMCPDSRQEMECKDFLCQGGERLFLCRPPYIPQLWLTASSVSDKPLCCSLISPSPRGQSFTPLNQSCPAPTYHFLPHLRLTQWHIRNAVRGFCWAVLHWDIEIQPKINFHRQRLLQTRPPPSLPSRLPAETGCFRGLSATSHMSFQPCAMDHNILLPFQLLCIV